MANWFLPFYPTHSSLDDSFPAESRKMVKIIKYAPFLCDSDKYSFCFSLASVPDSQKSAMMGQMDIHNTDLQELESTELPDDKKNRATHQLMATYSRFTASSLCFQGKTTFCRFSKAIWTSLNCHSLNCGGLTKLRF